MFQVVQNHFLLSDEPKQLIKLSQTNSPWFRDLYAPSGATWISGTAGYASNSRNTSNSRKYRQQR
jgi:hypothetical protein